jgi:hypothetical protein
MLFGHLAVSTLQHRYLKADLVPVVVAGIFPDVVDKTLCQILHLTSNGRTLGHTLVGLGLSTVVVRLIWGRRTAWSWALGCVGHLLGDSGGFVPWLYPFVRYDFPQHSPGLFEMLWRELRNPAAMGLELALSAWAVCALYWPRTKIRVVSYDYRYLYRKGCPAARYFATHRPDTALPQVVKLLRKP